MLRVRIPSATQADAQIGRFLFEEPRCKIVIGKSVTAAANSNIALIKYWGNRDHSLRLPSNGSISMTLNGLETKTTVKFHPDFPSDQLTINGQPATTEALARVSKHLDYIRGLRQKDWRAIVESQATFPIRAGIASSASAFASLTVAACAALDLELGPKELSRIARRGSGSACRSIFGGFVEWYASERDEDSYAEPLRLGSPWELVDLVAVVSQAEKAMGSSQGHLLADSSPLQVSRVLDAPRRLSACRQALLERDFNRLAEVVEQDCNMMHAVMLTSTPPLLYWYPQTVSVMQSVARWRSQGLHVCYTIDAGPNVHCICLPEDAEMVKRNLRKMPGLLQILEARPGPAARLVEILA